MVAYYGVLVLLFLHRSKRNELLQELHDIHPGISRMKALARSYALWPNMDSDIELTSCFVMYVALASL